MSPVTDNPSSHRTDRLLDAALTAFDELGYAATPVPAIAHQAGVAVGSIYRYFESKEQLANQLYRREKQRMAAALFESLDTDASPEEVFRAIWRRLVDYATGAPAALCFLELHHHDGYLDGASRALAAAIDEQVATLLRRWQRSGHVREGDPFLLSAQVFGGFVGVVRHLRAMGRPIDATLSDITLEPAWALLSSAGGTASTVQRPSRKGLRP